MANALQLGAYGLELDELNALVINPRRTSGYAQFAEYGRITVGNGTVTKNANGSYTVANASAADQFSVLLLLKTKMPFSNVYAALRLTLSNFGGGATGAASVQRVLASYPNSDARSAWNNLIAASNPTSSGSYAYSHYAPLSCDNATQTQKGPWPDWRCLIELDISLSGGVLDSVTATLDPTAP